MKRAIVLGVGILIGVALAYASRSVVATGMLFNREPTLISASLYSIAESSAFCSQDDLKGQKGSLLRYEGLLGRALAHNPNDPRTAFYYALAEARLSAVESELNNPSQAAAHMQVAQREFSKLGWKDISPGHIQAIVAYIHRSSSEQQHSGQPSVMACSGPSLPATSHSSPKEVGNGRISPAR